MGTKSENKVLPLKFYIRPTKIVAQDLLGRVLCRRLAGGEILRTRIVETEAYTGVKDRAAHTYGGRRTARTENMWQGGGRAYVYFIYGMHECLNAVTRNEGEPEAVLIRAGEPLSGHERWELELPHLKQKDWLKGPGRLCRAMHITRKQNGDLLNGDEVWIEAGTPIARSRIGTSSRIGVDYAGEWAAAPLRFFDKKSESVSGPKHLLTNPKKALSRKPRSAKSSKPSR